MSMQNITIRECLPDRHKRRDNKYGITWCIKCGQLFTKPCGSEFQKTEQLIIPYNKQT